MAAGVQRPGFADGSRSVPLREQDDLRVSKPPRGYGVVQGLSQHRCTGGHSDRSWYGGITNCRMYLYSVSHSSLRFASWQFCGWGRLFELIDATCESRSYLDAAIQCQRPESGYESPNLLTLLTHWKCGGTRTRASRTSTHTRGITHLIHITWTSQLQAEEDDHTLRSSSSNTFFSAHCREHWETEQGVGDSR